MEDILQQIADAGIKTDAERTPVYKTRPQFRQNYGFYHIITDEWQTLFIKGVYRGNIRTVKGECPVPEKRLNEMAQLLSDVERCLRRPADVELAEEEDVFYVVSAKPMEMPFLSEDMRDFNIPTPVTPVEISLAKTEGASQKHLFSKTPFTSVFGDILSPVAYSVLDGMRDLMNPLFMSAEIKTHSPSVKTFFGRAYLNIDNFETVMSAFYANRDILFMNFIPSVFMKIQKPAFDIPKTSVLKIDDEEIEQGIKDIAESAAALNTDELFSEKFAELIGLSAMTWEMVYLGLWGALAKAIKTLGLGMDDTLRHLYKTCPAGIIGEDAEIMPFFDPAWAPVAMKGVKLETVPAEKMYATLPSGKRLFMSKAKYSAVLDEFHRYINMRDKTYAAISGLVRKVREILLAEGEKLKENNVLTDANDIFFFELKEIKNIVKDEFFGNVPFTLNFRRWQTARFGAVCLPNYLFEKDVADYEDIAFTQVNNFEKNGIMSCMGFFHKDKETDNYVCKSGFSPCDIAAAAGADAVVAESATLFSHIMQYCAATDTPLYTGARLSPLLLRGKKIKTFSDHISI